MVIKMGSVMTLVMKLSIEKSLYNDESRYNDVCSANRAPK